MANRKWNESYYSLFCKRARPLQICGNLHCEWRLESKEDAPTSGSRTQNERGPVDIGIERSRSLDDGRRSAGARLEGFAENESWLNGSAALNLRRTLQGGGPVCRDLILIKEFAKGAIVIRADGEWLLCRGGTRSVAGTTA